MNNKREHFRLEYPPTERPTVVVDGGGYPVLDLSESGLKWFCGPKWRQTLPPFLARIVFADGSTYEIAGKVMRHDMASGICVVTLTQGIPLAKMHEEQRLLIRKLGPK